MLLIVNTVKTQFVNRLARQASLTVSSVVMTQHVEKYYTQKQSPARCLLLYIQGEHK